MTDFVPNARVEVAFSSGYATPAASRVWTDITEWVRFGDGLSITRGRQDEAGDIDASALAFTVDNRDGRFTPGRVSSPYWPNVKKGRPVRVVYTWAGVEYVRFTGYVDSWPVSWSGGTDSDAEVSVSASSRFARLAAGAELRDAPLESILTNSPLDFWPFADPEGSTGAANIIPDGSGPLQPLGAVTFGQAAPSQLPGAVSLGSTSATLTGTTTPTVTLVEFYANFPSLSETVGICRSTANVFFLEPGGTLRMDSGTFYNMTATVPLGEWVHVVGGWWDGAAQLWVNGVLEDTLAGAPDVGSYASGDLVAVGAFDYFGGTLPAANGLLMSALAIHPAVSAPSDDDIIARAQFRSGGFADATIGDAISRVASYVPILDVEMSVSAGSSAGSFVTAGTTPLALMQDLNATDGGRLYDARDGKLTFRGRDSYWNPTPAFTLSALLQEVEASLAPILDDQGMVNDVGGVRVAEGATPYRATNAASVDEYGPYRADLSLLTASDYDVTGTIWWLVNTRGEPRVRLPQVEVAWEVLDNTTTKAAMLEADLGAVFTLADLPEQAPAAEMRLTIEGYAETLTATELRFSFNTTDASPLYVFTLDSDSLGLLDSDTRLAY